MEQDSFESLDIKCKEIENELTRTEDHKTKMKLRRELYTTKLLMVDILDTEDNHKGVTAKELIEDVNSRKSVPRYSLGYEVLDNQFRGGIEVGTFIQLAGQSFVGKTHFVLELLSNIAGAHGAVFFNFEMGDVRVAKRLEKILLTDAQLENLIVDGRTRDIDLMINEIRIYARKGYRFFAIDSKMKITSGEKDDFKRFGDITSKLARICQENDIIVFLINQISEDDMKNGRLAFKGSGDQMYDADISLFYTMDKKGEKRKMICNKNRQDEKGFVLGVSLSNDNTLHFFKPEDTQ